MCFGRMKGCKRQYYSVRTTSAIFIPYVYYHSCGHSLGLELFHYLLYAAACCLANDWHLCLCWVICEGWPWLAFPPVGLAQATFCCSFVFQSRRECHLFEVNVLGVPCPGQRVTVLRESGLVQQLKSAAIWERLMLCSSVGVCVDVIPPRTQSFVLLPWRWKNDVEFFVFMVVMKIFNSLAPHPPRSPNKGREGPSAWPFHGGYKTVIARWLGRCRWVTRN